MVAYFLWQPILCLVGWPYSYYPHGHTSFDSDDLTRWNIIISSLPSEHLCTWGAVHMLLFLHLAARVNKICKPIRQRHANTNLLESMWKVLDSRHHYEKKNQEKYSIFFLLEVLWCYSNFQCDVKYCILIFKPYQVKLDYNLLTFLRIILTFAILTR